MKRGNFIVSQSKIKKNTHTQHKDKEETFEIGFAKPAKHATESNHLDFSVSQNLPTKA